MAQRRRQADGEAWIVVEVRAPRWAVWCVAAGTVLLGVAGLLFVWLAA